MTTRTTDTMLDQVFLDRWSPRAFDASDMPQADLATIFDAARFAPSASNYQPWRLLYARRGDENWERFLSYLMAGNKSWAQNASVILYILSERHQGGPEKASHSHSFDAGCAWGMLAIQATMLGYHSHAMAGVHFKEAAEGLCVPDDIRVEAAVVLGRQGDPAILSDSQRERETPSGRKPRDEIAYPGNFRA